MDQALLVAEDMVMMDLENNVPKVAALSSAGERFIEAAATKSSTGNMEVGLSETTEMDLCTMDMSVLANNIDIVYDEHIPDPEMYCKQNKKT